MNPKASSLEEGIPVLVRVRRWLDFVWGGFKVQCCNSFIIAFSYEIRRVKLPLILSYHFTFKSILYWKKYPWSHFSGVSRGILRNVSRAFKKGNLTSALSGHSESHSSFADMIEPYCDKRASRGETMALAGCHSYGTSRQLHSEHTVPWMFWSLPREWCISWRGKVTRDWQTHQ
jgi:hypothetical protein